MKKYLTLIAGALLATACSNDIDTATEQPTTRQPIAFSMTLDGGAAKTRAANAITSDADLRNVAFGVFAAYTGHLKYEQTTVSCDYMYNQKVTALDGSTDAWTYNPVKYWPNDALDYVSFYAYAPYAEKLATDDEGGIIDMSRNYDLGDPWINFRMPSRPWATAQGAANQVDLLYMQRREGAEGSYTYRAWDDQHNPFKPESKLDFVFMHALACVGDTVTLRLSQELADYIDGYATISVDSVSIAYKNLTTKARLVLRTSGGQANWKEIISGELTTTRTFEKRWETPLGATTGLTTDVITIIEGQGLFYIPLRIRGTDAPYAEVTVQYSVNNGVSSSKGSVSGTFPLDMDLEGKRQNINLVLGENLPLNHLVMPIGGDANEPSFSRQQ